MKLSLLRWLAVIAVLTMILGGCAPAATTPAPAAPAEKAAEPTKAPEPTAAPAAEEKAAEPTATPAAEQPAAAPDAAAKKAKYEEYAAAPREETLILDNPYRLEGDGWNPYVPANLWSWGGTISADPLVLLSYGTGKIENWMAESFTSNEDATEWTLKLRDGITWSDGVPLTIDDVLYSIQLQMDTENLGAHFTYKEWIKSVEKIDDKTMKFILNKPNVRFALDRFADGLCGTDDIVPKHVWENVDDPLTFKNYDPEKGWPLVTGPYVLYKLTTNEAIWVRNDDWWAAKVGLKKLPQPKKIIFSYAGTEEVRVATAIDNGFDGLQDITLSSFEALKAGNPNWRAFRDELPYVWPDPCARTISINDSKEPWNDKDMRWVLSNVMDRQQIIEIAYEGTSIPGAYFWPLYPSMQPYTDMVPKDKEEWMLTPHLDEAEKTLTAKGYTKNGDYWEKDGKQLSLEIQVHEAFSELERVADVYVEQLQRFGINAVKVKLTGNTWGDNFNFGNFEAMSGWQTCGSIMEPYATLHTMAGDPAPIGSRPEATQNAYRWYNKEYTDLVTEIGTLQWDDPKLKEDTTKALEILYTELPVIPSAQSRKLIPWNETYWTNFPRQDNYYQRPVLWCPSFIGMLPEIQKVQK